MKWKKDETVFRVSLHYDERRGTIAIIPKPVLAFLGNPGELQFAIECGKITVSGGAS